MAAVSLVVATLYWFVGSLMTTNAGLPSLASNLILGATALATILAMLSAYASAMTRSRYLWVGLMFIALAAISFIGALVYFAYWRDMPIAGLAVGYAGFLAWLTAYGFWKTVAPKEVSNDDDADTADDALSGQRLVCVNTHSVSIRCQVPTTALEADAQAPGLIEGIRPSHLLAALLLGLVLGLSQRIPRRR